ncbi:MAG: VOC family protein [Gemmataceae bacterium]
MGSVKLSLIVLKTRQVDALRKFYRSLWIELIMEQHGNGPVHFAGQIGEVLLEVYPLPNEGTPTDTSTRLGFTVANMNKVIEKLKDLETTVVSEPQASQWGMRAVVRDPDGRAVEIYQ